MGNSVGKVFGNRVRVRVSGLLFREEKLLLIKHRMDDYELWAPPGGGVEFGESIEATLVREFREETGIVIEVKGFLFLTEHINPPLHAIELFYHVTSNNTEIIPGIEPEIEDQNILQEFRFTGTRELKEIDPNELHLALKSCTNPIELLDKRGHLK